MMSTIFSPNSPWAYVYYVLIGIMGLTLFVAAARGAFPRLGGWQRAIYLLVLPVIFFNQLVIPDYVGGWGIPEISLTSHIIAVLPLNIALLMSIQNSLDAQGETRNRRVATLIAISAISTVLVFINPSQDTMIASIALNLVSLAIPLRYEFRQA